MASDPLIHYRRIPGTRRYYDPSSYQTVSDRQVQNYRKTLTPSQQRAIRTESRRVATSTRGRRNNLVSAYQRRLDAEGLEEDATTRAHFAELYAKIHSYGVQEKEWIGLPEYAEQLAALRDPNGDYADTLVELGMRDPDSTDPVGSSPPGTASTLYT